MCSVHAFGWKVRGKGGRGVGDVCVCHICGCLRRGAKKVWGADPAHGKYEINAKKWMLIRREGGYDIGETAYILRAEWAAVESVGYVPFRQVNRAIRRVCFPDALEDSCQARSELHGTWVVGGVRGLVD